MNNTDNTQNTLNALIDRTLTIIDNGLDRSVGDMKLLEALELVGVLMDMRERQQAYQRNQTGCQKACTKKPKRM